MLLKYNFVSCRMRKYYTRTIWKEILQIQLFSFDDRILLFICIEMKLSPRETLGTIENRIFNKGNLPRFDILPFALI